MSLTSRIARDDVKNLLRSAVVTPRISPPSDLRVSARSTEPTLLGTAFDYALRAGLIFRFPGEHGPLRAERGLRSAVGQAMDAETRSALKSLFVDAGDAFRAVAAGAHFDVQVARGFFKLSMFEHHFRSPVSAFRWVEPPIRELELLCALNHEVPWAAFEPEGRLLCNPEFCEGTQALGGADADLVIDGVLVEVKTSLRPQLQAKTVHQLVAYALLANAFGLDDPCDAGVAHIGYYNARTATLITYHLDECIRPENYAAVLAAVLDQPISKELAEAVRGRVEEADSVFGVAGLVHDARGGIALTSNVIDRKTNAMNDC